MKKIAVIIISVFCALMAGQVFAEEKTEEKTFCATVLEIDEAFILVQPHFDTEEYDNSDQMYVGLDEVDHAQLEEFLDMVTVDDTVQITYNGKIMETYPAQIIASDIECLETSEMAATVAELIEGEGFQTEFSMGGSEYCCEYAESLTIWPSAEEDDPEGDPDEEVDYTVTLGWIYSFEFVKIASGEMVILNTNSVLEEDDESTFLGHFTGDDICYTVGYICDGAYTEVQNSVTDEDYSGGVSAEQAGEVCWCVLNTSSSEVIMDGSIRIAANDLVFRDYGEEFITLNEACTLVIDASAAVLNSSIQRVYLYDYDTKQETEIGNSTKIICKVSEPGVYIIYAVTEDGEVVNLKNYVTIETETSEGSGITTLHFERDQNK